MTAFSSIIFTSFDLENKHLAAFALTFKLPNHFNVFQMRFADLNLITV